MTAKYCQNCMFPINFSQDNPWLGRLLDLLASDKCLSEEVLPVFCILTCNTPFLTGPALENRRHKQSPRDSIRGAGLNE